MVEIVKSGGWLMAPIILCAIIAMGIILERFWTLQQKRVIPEDLTSKVWGWVKKDQLDQKQIQSLHQGSALGQILAAGLINRDRERDVMKDSIQDTGRHVVHELERYLETLGTIAAITPLLGLLGTVIGMVKVFTAITTHGVGNPTVLAGGIAEALITTAAGLTVAIPALIGYRYYRNRVESLVVEPASAYPARGQPDFADRRRPAAADLFHGVDQFRQAVADSDQPAGSRQRRRRRGDSGTDRRHDHRDRHLPRERSRVDQQPAGDDTQRAAEGLRRQ